MARMPGWCIASLRTRFLTAAVFVTFASTAGAQVQATFYQNYPSTPDPLGSYLGGNVLCSASTFGTSSGGFTLNFNDAATRTALCPSNPDLLSPFLNNQLGARFTGSLFVSSTGSYSVTLNADDGDALAINGAVIRTDWFAKAGGPGTITVGLNSGLNPFVFDYFQGPCCNAFAQLLPGQGVTISPPDALPPALPEPPSLALVAAGLGLLGVGARWRGRSRSAIKPAETP